MRKVLKSIGIVVCSCILTATPVMGATAQQVEYMDGEQWKQTVVHMYDRRGNWIADGMLSISNPRNGKIGIYMSTLCHQPVDEIEMSIAIDQYKGYWDQVDYLTYNFYPEDGESLVKATVDIELPGHEVDQLYKLRGTHIVYVNSGSESLDSETGDMLITDH